MKKKLEASRRLSLGARKLLLLMRLTFFLILTSVFASAANVYSQTTRLTVIKDNCTVAEVFDAIEKQSEFYFFYNRDKFDDSQIVSVNFSGKTLEQILVKLFEDQSVTYEIVNKNILIKTIPDSKDRPDVDQQKSVSGRVTDSSGTPLPGVTVVIKETTNGTVTDSKGEYSISSIPTDAILIFSFVGMHSQEQVVGDQSVIDVVLLQDAIGIDEVVAVGYGTQKRSDVTGAMSTVKVENLQGMEIKSIDQALQGRVAGLNFIQNSGMPGAASVIRIRGGNSINGGNEPLYVIDGIPVYQSPSSSANSISGLNSINTSDIESIEVLKDASATAIYGSRGGNGVILITTKKGKKGEDMIRYQSSVSLQTPRNKYDMLDASQYQKMANEAIVNEGGEPFYDESLNPPTTDWQDLAMRTAPTHNHSLSFTGGSDKTQYYLSLGYLDQNGVIHNSGMERISIRSNVKREIKEWIEVGTDITWSKVMTDRVSSSVLGGMLTAPPDLPVTQPDGSYTKYYTYKGSSTDFNNPIAYMNDFVDYNQNKRFLGSMYANIKFSKNLKLKILGGIDAANSKRDYYNPLTTITGFRVDGSASVSAFQTDIWLNENTLDYTFENSTHRLNALIGFTQQGSRYESVGAASQGFSNDILQMNDLGSGLEPQIPSSALSQWRLQSYLGRINYSYKGKYLATLTGRYDGSSRFGENNRFGFFPSAALAWRAIEETFIKDLDVFSNLKVRLSYGLTGNQDGIGTYPGVATMGDVRYSFNENKVVGMLISKPSNKDLKWESTVQSNLGIEMGFFSNRLSFLADLYHKRTNDLLLNVTIPATSGFTNAIKNIGSIENKGIELSIKGTPVVGVFTWDTDFNIATNQNKIVDLGGQDIIVPADRAPNDANILLLNQALGIFYGYETNGVFSTYDEILESGQPSTQLGDVWLVDQDDNKIINEDDKVILGKAQPKFFGGWNNAFRYKNFDFSFFIRYSYGNEIYNVNRFNLQDLTGKRNNTTAVLDRWTEDNRDTDIPRASTVKTTNIATDREVEDGSYIRLKTIQIGYNFPSSWFNNKIQSLRIYFSGENLYTITNYSGYDPEVSAYGASNVKMGFDSSTYPSVKTIKFGLNVSF